jgi:hypothetical protein
MIDLETLGTGDGAAIVQIGAAWFGETGGFVRDIDLKDPQIGTIDAPTVGWWLAQGQEVSRKVFFPAPRISLRQALEELAAFIEGADGVWGHGSLFDLRLLRQAYERVGLTYPIPYRAELCHRTLLLLGRQMRVELPQRLESDVKHDALGDARHQARCALRILSSIRPSDPFQPLEQDIEL